MAHLYVSVTDEDARVLSVSYDPEQGKNHVSAFMNASVRPGVAIDRRQTRKEATAWRAWQ